MQVLGETERQKQYVDTHAHQLKRLTGLVRHLETQIKSFLDKNLKMKKLMKMKMIMKKKIATKPLLLMTC